MATYSAILRGASRVYTVDHVEERLGLAESIGAVPVNFMESDPVEQIMSLEGDGRGVRRGVEAVGYEAINATGAEDSEVTLRNLIRVTAAHGGIGVVGLFGSFAAGGPDAGNAGIPYGDAYSKRVSIDGGVVLPLQMAGEIVPLIESGQARPSFIVSSVIGLEQAPEYYGRFNRTEESKVVIVN